MTELSWILSCVTGMGLLERAHSYKDKIARGIASSAGLFTYPCLMAADILLYQADLVPVGEDQKQHVELARDVAQRFNSRYGETFVLPEPVIAQTGARIMGLVDPTKKMGKSDSNPNSRINLLDSKDEIIKKIKSATTDSGSEIKFDPKEKPGISNLIQIYSTIKGVGFESVITEFQGKNYGEFKEAVAESVVGILTPIQEKYEEIRNSSKLTEVLESGVEKAREISGKKLNEVYEKVGFYL